MTFQQFAKTLRPYYGENRSQDEFVVLLFDNILDIYNENAKGNSPAHIKFRSYNPLKNYDKFQSDTISRYYKGNRISPDTYSQMLKYLNTDNFVSFMEKPSNPTPEMDGDLVESIKEFSPDVSDENYPEKYAELFVNMIQKGAKEPKKQSGRKKKIHYPKDTSASSMEILEDKITAAGNLISKRIKAENLPEPPNITYCIKEKIKNDNHLMRCIENDLIYFDIVNKAFVSAAENGGKPPAFICQCIHNQYLRLKEKYFTEKEIVDNMQNYFAPIALIQPNSPEARIIVSYFILLCEVFDAPAR